MKKKIVKKVKYCVISLFLVFLILTLNGCPISYSWVTGGSVLKLFDGLFINGANIYDSQNSANSQAVYPQNQPGFQAVSAPHQPGASPARSFVVGPLGETLEIYKTVISFPGSFSFNGFGATGDTAGAYKIITRNGTEVLSSSLVALDTDTAYIDLNLTGAYESQWEPIVTHALTSGTHEFTLILPGGGDGDTTVNARDITDKGVFEISSGILANPTTEGSYEISMAFTSVDPDSGEADDSQGTAPTTQTVSINTYITSGPSIVVYTDATNYSVGDTQTLYVMLSNPSSQSAVDVYVAKMFPDGSLQFLDASTGTFTLVSAMTPFVSNLTLTPGFDLSGFSLLQHTFTDSESSGLYTWYIALTTPGTTDFIGGIGSSSFYLGS